MFAWSMSIGYHLRISAGRHSFSLFVLDSHLDGTERNTFIDDIVALHNKLLHVLRTAARSTHREKKSFFSLGIYNELTTELHRDGNDSFSCVCVCDERANDERKRDEMILAFFAPFFIAKEKARYASHTHHYRDRLLRSRFEAEKINVRNIQRPYPCPLSVRPSVRSWLRFNITCVAVDNLYLVPFLVHTNTHI